MTIRGLMVRWLRLVDGLVDRLLGLMLLSWLNVGVRRLSLVGSLRSVNREVSRWTVNTQPWLGSSDLGLGLRSPELNIWGFVVLTESRASILGLRSLGLGTTLLEVKLGGVEVELGAEGLDVWSLEGVAELRSSEGEITGLAAVVEGGAVDVELGLRSIDTELGSWSLDGVLNGWASVLERSVGGLVDVLLGGWLVEAVSGLVGLVLLSWLVMTVTTMADIEGTIAQVGIVAEVLTVATIADLRGLELRGRVASVGARRDLWGAERWASWGLVGRTIIRGGSVGWLLGLVRSVLGFISAGAKTGVLAEAGFDSADRVVSTLSADTSTELLAGGTNRWGLEALIRDVVAETLSADASTELLAGGANVSVVLSIEATAFVKGAGVESTMLSITDMLLLVVRLDVNSLILEIKLLLDLTLVLEVSGLVLEIKLVIEIVLVLEVLDVLLLTLELEVGGWGAEGWVLTILSVRLVVGDVMGLVVRDVGISSVMRIRGRNGGSNSGGSDSLLHLICFLLLRKNQNTSF